MKKKKQGNFGKNSEKNLLQKPQFYPEKTIKDILDWFKTSQFKFVFIGGFAVSLHGSPRATKDIDAVTLIDFDFLSNFLEVGKKFGIVARISDLVTFAKQKRVLLLLHQPSGTPIDISIGALPFEWEMIENSKIIRVDSLKIPIARVEDLIVMKILPRRPWDIADIEHLLTTNPNLNLKKTRYWITEFSKVLENPEILEDFEKILKRVRK